MGMAARLVEGSQVTRIEIAPVREQQVPGGRLGLRQKRLLRSAVRGHHHTIYPLLQQIHVHMQLHRRRADDHEPRGVPLGGDYPLALAKRDLPAHGIHGCLP